MEHRFLQDRDPILLPGLVHVGGERVLQIWLLFLGQGFKTLNTRSQLFLGLYSKPALQGFHTSPTKVAIALLAEWCALQVLVASNLSPN